MKIIVSARLNPLTNIASTMKSNDKFYSYGCLDACTCTGNCED